MLHQRYAPDRLAGIFFPREAWHPYPALPDRAAWVGLSDGGEG